MQGDTTSLSTKNTSIYNEAIFTPKDGKRYICNIKYMVYVNSYCIYMHVADCPSVREINNRGGK